MKKIIFILSIFLSCYIIYNVAYHKEENYMTMGNSLSQSLSPYNAKIYGYSEYLYDYLRKDNKSIIFNQTWTNKDYRITDLINTIKSNEIKNNISINEDLRNADILSLSIGMTELYHHMEYDIDKIYEYVDEINFDMDKLLNLISRYNYNHVFVLGYYNINNSNNDIFTYANYHLKKIVQKYNYTYIDLSNLNTKYFINNKSFNPNIEGYYVIYQKLLEKI